MFPSSIAKCMKAMEIQHLLMYCFVAYMTYTGTSQHFTKIVHRLNTCRFYALEVNYSSIITWQQLTAWGRANIFKWIFVNGKAGNSFKISLTFIHRGPINNIPALVQITAWRLYKVWKGIIYPLTNFNGATVEVCELISNFIPHFTAH